MNRSDQSSNGGRSPLTVAGLAQAMALVLGAVGTIWSIINNGHISANAEAISQLQTQLQLSAQFATGVESTRRYITSEASATATLELVRLYALASTPQQKLSVMEVAVDAGQTAAVATLTALVHSEQFYLHPANDSEKAAKHSLDTLASVALTVAQATETPSPKPTSSPPKKGRAPRPTPSPLRTPFNDNPLTQSSNKKVAASATLLAGLSTPKKGWIFLGDAYASASEENAAHLFAATATTSKASPPAIGETLVACKDINLRSYPFLPSGELGSLVGIIGTGTPMTVTAPPTNQPAVLPRPGIGKVSGRPIIAYWAYVEAQLDNSPAQTSC